MVCEFMLAGAFVYAFDRFRCAEEYKIKKIFTDICNNDSLGYKIIETKQKEHGFDLIVSLCYEGYDKLESLKDKLESTYGHMAQIEQNENLKTATISVITSKLNDKIKFTPVKLESPAHIYAGLDYKFKKLICNFNTYPHCLVSGQTGSGKTEEIRLILTNHIYNFSDRDLNIYFSDLSDMCDFDVFQNCKQVKGYAKTIYESLKLFEYMMHIYTKRLELFSKSNCKNIKEYNQQNYDKRMSYIFLVLDEFADYYPSNKHEDNYEEKIKCYNILKHLVRKTRKVGCMLCCGIQRPDTTVLDPSLRSGLCTKIGFSQNTDSSSLVVCDTIELTNIEHRKGLFMFGNVREWFKSLYITDKIIKEYIKDSITKDRTDFNKFLNKRAEPNNSDGVKKETLTDPKTKSTTKPKPKKTTGKVKTA